MDYFIILTKDTGKFIGPITNLLGYVMEFIFNFLSSIGIANVGLSIILFTLAIRFCMLPLTIKQQKFSKMSAIMNPELQAINKKYKGKRDQDSMMKMQEETKVVYEKYGVSPSGSCLQLIIQLPIMLALYRVIMRIPAYIPQIRAYYQNVVDVIAKNGLFEQVDKIYNENKEMLDIATSTDLTQAQSNSIIDLLSTFSTDKWNQLTELLSGSDLTKVNEAIDHINSANSFLGINLAQSPSAALGIALIIPVLAGLTQWFSMKLSNDAMKQNSGNDDNPMGSSMKIMTYMMPLMSVFFCYSFQAGIGLYWVVGAVYQIMFQIGVNIYFKKVDMNDLIQKNIDKANKKRAKKGLPPKKIASNAQISTKYADAVREANKKKQEEDKKDKVKKSTDYYNKNASKPGSLASKANMVKAYDEKNKNKNKNDN